MPHENKVYFEKLESQIEDWRKRLDALAAKAEEMTADARHAYEKAIEERRAKLALAREKLDALRQVGSDKWKEGRATLESFWKEAKAVFDTTPPPPAN